MTDDIIIGGKKSAFSPFEKKNISLCNKVNKIHQYNKEKEKNTITINRDKLESKNCYNLLTKYKNLIMFIIILIMIFVLLII